MWGKREIIYLSLHCHHQDDSCIKMGSDESHFNVSVGSDGQSHKTQCPQTRTFLKRKESRSEVLPLIHCLTSDSVFRFTSLAQSELWILPVCFTPIAPCHPVFKFTSLELSELWIMPVCFTPIALFKPSCLQVHLFGAV